MTDTADLRMRGATTVDLTDSSESADPYMKKSGSFTREMSSVLTDPQAKKVLGLTVLNVVCVTILLTWCNTTNSMALTAYAYLTIFDIFGLMTCLVSIWVQRQKPTPIFSFGYERFEVLAIFASTMLAQFGSLFIVKESVERMMMQPEIHTGRLLTGTSVAFCAHLLVRYTMDNRAFNHVIEASSSSWLQEHVSEISESICNVIPGISKLLLPRINPFALIAFAGAGALFLVYLLIDIRNYYAIDTWVAMWIAMMTCGTMFPMSVYSGKILLQTTPSHIIGQLDKCIREASTLDGVLEFRHEHFWTLSFGTMAGSVHVRVRRDADEQLVLAHVYNRMSNLVLVLTVQIFKDDWSRPSTMHILNNLSGSFTTTSPTSGPARSPSPPGLYTPAVSQRSSSPFGGLGFAPALIPSRTDPAIVDSMNGPSSPNIPAMRLAANANNFSWNRANLVPSDPNTPPLPPPPLRSTNDVVSLSNIGSNYIGSGLNLGAPGRGPSAFNPQPLQPSIQRPEQTFPTPQSFMGKQT